MSDIVLIAGCWQHTHTLIHPHVSGALLLLDRQCTLLHVVLLLAACHTHCAH